MNSWGSDSMHYGLSYRASSVWHKHSTRSSRRDREKCHMAQCKL